MDTNTTTNNNSVPETRKHNFNGEQCALPTEVLLNMQKEWFSVEQVGVTMLEMFNKQPKYLKLLEKGEVALRQLLAIPNEFKVYTMAGGQALQISAVPLNLLGNSDTATYYNTGYWGEKAIAEARRYVSNVNVCQNVRLDESHRIIVQESAAIAANTAYVHYTSDDPVDGIQLKEQPRRPSDVNENTLMVADLSGDFLTRRVDWTQLDVAYVSSEYQAGISGSILLIIRESAIRTPHPLCPYMIDYAALKAFDGSPNTPPTFPMYVNAKVFLHAVELGGIDVIQNKIEGFAKRIYSEIDTYPLVYDSKVDERYRSNVHIVFRVKGVQQDSHFVDEALRYGIVGLQQRRNQALRISLSLGTTEESVKTLVNFIQEYAQRVTASSLKPLM